MSYILNIETATRNCSVSIAKDGETIALREVADQGYSHAEKLHVFIEEIIKETGLAFKDLSAIAISQGPGSYTGLRIGVSSAKGFCFALNIPLIAVDTLQVLASQVKVDSGFIVPMLDARRMEVYSAVYNHKLEKTREVIAEIIDENSYADYKEPMYIVGDCQDKLKPVFLTRSNFHFMENVVFPSAKDMSALSYAKFQNNDFVDVAYFEPYYLKDFVVTKPSK